MYLLAKVLALALLAASVGWFWAMPGYDSGVAVAAALAALIPAFLLKPKPPAALQSQHVEANAMGIQAGRDAIVNTAANKVPPK